MNDLKKLFVFRNRSEWLPWLISTGLVVGMLVVLHLQGRVWWCELGDWSIYISAAWNSSHTSQHFLDPYSWTHLLHGVFFFVVAVWLIRKWRPAWQFAIAIGIEVAWEIFENTQYVIDKYRANTASLDYFGDSILNSLADVLCCALGFVIAYKIGWKWSILLFVAVELMLLVTIRDSLVLNVIMLLYPLDAIKDWQMVVAGG